MEKGETKDLFKNLTLTFETETFHALYIQAVFWRSLSKLGPKEQKYCQDLLHRFTLTLNFDIEMWFKVKAHLLTKGNLLITYEHDWPKGKESIIKNWISKRHTLTFTVDLEKWFKITTHPLPTLTLHVNYKPDRANGENAWSRQVI